MRHHFLAVSTLSFKERRSPNEKIIAPNEHDYADAPLGVLLADTYSEGRLEDASAIEEMMHPELLTVSGQVMLTVAEEPGSLFLIIGGTRYLIEPSNVKRLKKTIQPRGFLNHTPPVMTIMLKTDDTGEPVQALFSAFNGVRGAVVTDDVLGYRTIQVFHMIGDEKRKTLLQWMNDSENTTLIEKAFTENFDDELKAFLSDNETN